MTNSQNPDVIYWYKFAETAAESNAWSEEQLTNFATKMCEGIALRKLKARDTHGFEIDPPDLPFPLGTVFLDQQEAVQWMRSVGPFDWKRNKRFASRGALQDECVLTIIRDLGHDPLSIPSYNKTGGKRGFKAEIRDEARKNKKLFSTDGQFDKAWERLVHRDDKRIKYEEDK